MNILSIPTSLANRSFRSKRKMAHVFNIHEKYAFFRFSLRQIPPGFVPIFFYGSASPPSPESRQTFWHETGGRWKAPFRSCWTWRRTQLVTNYFPIFARKWQNTATNCVVKSKLTRENFTTIWPWRELNGSVCVCGRAMGKARDKVVSCVFHENDPSFPIYFIRS